MGYLAYKKPIGKTQIAVNEQNIKTNLHKIRNFRFLKNQIIIATIFEVSAENEYSSRK